MHKIDIRPELIERLTQERNGRLHIFDEIDPARTAHVIVDLQNGFMEVGAPVEVPIAREIIPSVNAISNAIRQAGGVNIFIQFTTPTDALESLVEFLCTLPARGPQGTPGSLRAWCALLAAVARAGCSRE